MYHQDKDLLKNVSRVLSAVVKMHTALVAVSATREGLETFGGAGYMEVTSLGSRLELLILGFVSLNMLILSIALT